MKRESELRVEKFSHLRDTLFQIFRVFMNEDEVIDISSVILDFQALLHESIELVHRDIRKELTREIPDRESASLSSREETLISWKSYPVGSPSYDLHSLSHISKNDGFYEVEEHILFVFWDPWFLFVISTEAERSGEILL